MRDAYALLEGKKEDKEDVMMDDGMNKDQLDTESIAYGAGLFATQEELDDKHFSAQHINGIFSLNRMLLHSVRTAFSSISGLQELYTIVSDFHLQAFDQIQLPLQELVVSTFGLDAEEFDEDESYNLAKEKLRAACTQDQIEVMASKDKTKLEVMYLNEFRGWVVLLLGSGVCLVAEERMAVRVIKKCETMVERYGLAQLKRLKPYISLSKGTSPTPGKTDSSPSLHTPLDRVRPMASPTQRNQSQLDQLAEEQLRELAALRTETGAEREAQADNMNVDQFAEGNHAAAEGSENGNDQEDQAAMNGNDYNEEVAMNGDDHNDSNDSNEVPQGDQMEIDNSTGLDNTDFTDVNVEKICVNHARRMVAEYNSVEPDDDAELNSEEKKTLEIEAEAQKELESMLQQEDEKEKEEKIGKEGPKKDTETSKTSKGNDSKIMQKGSKGAVEFKGKGAVELNGKGVYELKPANELPAGSIAEQKKFTEEINAKLKLKAAGLNKYSILFLFGKFLIIITVIK